MLVAFWVLAAASLALAVLQLVVALRLRTSLRPSGTRPAKGHGARPPVSVLVPLKGAPAGLEFRLRRLLANLDEADQLVLAMETEDDPAHAVARALQEGHPDRDVTVVLSGPAGERMGKQHNLAAALPHARHEVLAFADDDVHVERAHLEEGAAVLQHVGVPTGQALGAAFAVPYYGAGGGPLGGDLVAAYTNHGFAPNMASLALRSPPRFIIGGFWMTTREALEAIGGLEPFTATVSDDAAIGRAFHGAGRRNVMLSAPVRLERERLDLEGGVEHVLKWLTLLRAEGLGVLLACYVTWHPLATWLLAALVAVAAPGVPDRLALLAFVVVAASRALAVFTLDGLVYGLQPVGRYLPMQLVYEALLAPALFLVAAFRREVVWRGRRYRLRPGGSIAEAG